MRRRVWFRGAPGVGAAVLWLLLFALTGSAAAEAVVPSPPPCPSSFDTEAIPTLIEDVKAVGDNNWEAGRNASCASKVLARKGEDIIPALLSLLDMRKRAVEQFALEAICGPGHTGATAVPYIEKRLREGGLSFGVMAYPTLACIGEGAQPLIPLLISKSQSIDLSFPAESDLATETLGALYQYDSRRILPQLIRLLDQPAHAGAAARALEKIGRPAQGAEEPLRRNLAAAVDASRDETAEALIAALGSVGRTQATVAALTSILDLYRPSLTTAAAKALGRFGSQASSAIPALIRRLQSPDAAPAERAEDVNALLAIDKTTPAVLKAVLEDIRRADNPGSHESAATALARIEPFPQELAPTVVSAIEAQEDDSGVRRLLEQTLSHSHTELKAQVLPKPAPLDVSDRMGSGLWGLTQQSKPIVVDDLVRLLHVDLNEYLYEGRTGDFSLTRKSAPADPAASEPPTEGQLIRSVHLTAVVQSSAHALSSPSVLPARQLLEISLERGACVSAEGVKSGISSSPGAESVTIVQDYSGRTGSRTIPYDGDHSPNKSLARSSELEAGPGCAGTVRIVKSFDPDYWNYVCPFTNDRAFIDANIVPALQSKFGTQFGDYDLESPEARDYGPTIALTYSEQPSDSSRKPAPAFRLSLEVDRCSRAVSNLSRYIP